MVNSNDLTFLKKKLTNLIEKQGYSRYDAINEIQEQLTTVQVGDRIRLAYDELNAAIAWQRSHGSPDKVAILNQLKKKVPYKYAITKDSMLKLNDTLNSLVNEYWGLNQSEIKKPAPAI